MSNFWHHKKVLITGHTGFKGSWLSLWLNSLGADLNGYALEPNAGGIFEACQLDSKMNSMIADIRDLEKLTSFIKKTKPEIIIHMAAQPLVKQSYNDPLETYQTNVMGLVHLFEAVRKTDSVRVVLNVTTDKCYENAESTEGYTEKDRLGGYDPYSNSKACAELVSASYRSSFFEEAGVNLATARAGNVIGGGDWASFRIVPDIVSSIQSDEPVELRSPNAVRPWQHVLEPLSGYMLLCEKLYGNGPEYDEAWNFGPAKDQCQSVQNLVGKFFEIAEKSSNNYKVLNQKDQEHETELLMLDSTKAKDKLGWSSKLDFEETIEMTWRWYEAFLKKEDVTSLSMNQIKTYSSIVSCS